MALSEEVGRDEVLLVGVPMEAAPVEKALEREEVLFGVEEYCGI